MRIGKRLVRECEGRAARFPCTSWRRSDRYPGLRGAGLAASASPAVRLGRSPQPARGHPAPSLTSAVSLPKQSHEHDARRPFVTLVDPFLDSSRNLRAARLLGLRRLGRIAVRILRHRRRLRCRARLLVGHGAWFCRRLFRSRPIRCRTGLLSGHVTLLSAAVSVTSGCPRERSAKLKSQICIARRKLPPR